MSYAKNRKELISEHLDQYGYIFCLHCKTSNSFKFHVHHIIFRSEKSNHPELHNKKNLIILCDKCHLKFHGKKDIRNYLIEERNLKELFESV